MRLLKRDKAELKFVVSRKVEKNDFSGFQFSDYRDIYKKNFQFTFLTEPYSPFWIYIANSTSYTQKIQKIIERKNKSPQKKTVTRLRLTSSFCQFFFYGLNYALCFRRGRRRERTKINSGRLCKGKSFDLGYTNKTKRKT